MDCPADYIQYMATPTALEPNVMTDIQHTMASSCSVKLFIDACIEAMLATTSAPFAIHETTLFVRVLHTSKDASTSAPTYTWRFITPNDICILTKHIQLIGLELLPRILETCNDDLTIDAVMRIIPNVGISSHRTITKHLYAGLDRHRTRYLLHASCK